MTPAEPPAPGEPPITELGGIGEDDQGNHRHGHHEHPTHSGEPQSGCRQDQQHQHRRGGSRIREQPDRCSAQSDRNRPAPARGNLPRHHHRHDDGHRQDPVRIQLTHRPRVRSHRQRETQENQGARSEISTGFGRVLVRARTNEERQPSSHDRGEEEQPSTGIGCSPQSHTLPTPTKQPGAPPPGHSPPRCDGFRVSPSGELRSSASPISEQAPRSVVCVWQSPAAAPPRPATSRAGIRCGRRAVLSA